MCEVAERIIMEDPSEYRPEFKNKKDFRDFSFHTVPERVIKVRKTYEYYINLNETQAIPFFRCAS